MTGERDRQRVLALLWLVGGVLTVLTLVLPYDVALDTTPRASVALLAFVTGGALVVAPTLPEWVLHGVLAAGTALIAFCTSLAVPDVEAVIFLLPVVYAFSAFTRRRALPHLLLMAGAYAVAIALAGPQRTVAPAISFTLVVGVAATLGVGVARLVEARERERLASRRDRRIAETLQRSLLPVGLPDTAGVAVAARYLPAAQEADVGGDLYDVIDLPDGRVGVAIGDVAGKGLPAAAAVGHVRAALRAYALDDPEPATVLRRLDHLLASQPAAPMATAFFGVLDPADGDLHYASAGHPPALVVPDHGRPHYLPPAPGVPLGVVPEAAFGGRSARLQPGDLLLLYTDGVIERRTSGVTDGLERLERVAVASRGGSPDALLDAVLATVPRAQRDDVAVLALGLSPAANRAPAPAPAPVPSSVRPALG